MAPESDTHMRPSFHIGPHVLWLIALLWGPVAGAWPASSETLRGALSLAFRANPLLDAQRHGTRAAYEFVPQARSKFLPRVQATADTGYLRLDTVGIGTSSRFLTRPRGYGVELSQTLFDGSRTTNGVRLADQQFQGAAETQSAVEQTTLFDAAAAYMAVVRDRDLVDFNRRNTAFLRRQLELVGERHAFGDVTRADVAQATARLAAGLLRLSAAQQQLQATSAVFQQVVGVAPGALTPARALDDLLPKDMASATTIALRANPAVLAAQHAFDAALSQVDIVNGEFAPTVSLNMSVSKRYDVVLPRDSQLDRTVVAQLSIPLFDGGETSSRSRQAKETASQRRLELDATREQVRAALVTGWSQFVASKAQIMLATTQFDAAARELTDTDAQYRYGLKSLTDVLLAQEDMLDAGTSLIAAQYDRVVASFAVLRALGRLTLDRLPADLDEHRKASPAARFPTIGGKRPGEDPALATAGLRPGICAVGCGPGEPLLLRPALGPRNGTNSAAGAIGLRRAQDFPE